MKKIVSVLVSLIFLLTMATAMAEVSFNDVTFLSTDDEVITVLIEKGFAKATTTSVLSNDDKSIYLVANEQLGFQPTYVQDYQSVCFSQIIPGLGKIAGCPVKKLFLTYAYDGNYKLITLKVELLGADYVVLLDKLTKVYGAAVTKTIEEEGITSNIWKDGSSAVVLYTESAGIDYTLVYGRIDAVEILSNCLATPDSNDVSGL